MKPAPLLPLAWALVIGSAMVLASCKPGAKPAEVPKDAPVTALAEEDGAPASDAFLVLPGDYAESATLADLEKRFGKANVRRETTPEPRVVLFPEDPGRRAYVTFSDADEKSEHLAGISVTDAGSRWRGKHGVEIGMTLGKLQALNRKPFLFRVEDDQQHGRVHDGWSPAPDGDDGTPGTLDVEDGEHLYFDVTLGPSDAEVIKAIPELPTTGEVSSADPRYRELREVLVVTGIGASSSLDDDW